MTPIALAVRSGNAPADQPPRVFTQEFTVGRHPNSGIVVANSSIVSGTHLRVVPTPQGWQIHLVSRTNGMLVDDAPSHGPVLVSHRCASLVSVRYPEVVAFAAEAVRLFRHGLRHVSR